MKHSTLTTSGSRRKGAKRAHRAVALSLVPALIWCTALSPQAHAGFAQTQTLIVENEAASHSDARTRLSTLLARQELMQGLEAYGVSAIEAQARVDAMTDAEVAALDQRLAELPAGGSIGTIILVFFILIVTDLLGATDVFPAIKPAR